MAEFVQPFCSTATNKGTKAHARVPQTKRGMSQPVKQTFEPATDATHHEWWRSAVIMFTSLGLCTFISFFVASYLDHENVIMIYLLGIVWVASQCRFRDALISCLLSVVTYDWFIVPPRYKFLPSDPQEAFTFAIMLVVAVVLARMTDRMRVQARLRGEQAELLDITNDAIFVWSLTDAKLEYWNSGAERMFGFTKAQALEHSVIELLHGESVESRDSIHDKLLKSDQWSGEVTYKHADGTPIVVASRLMVKRDKTGTPQVVVEFATDIRERKFAETRIREFYSVISHELRTPLTSVYGSLKLMDSSIVPMDSDTSRELVKISALETKKVIGLVNDILDLQKIEAGMLEVVMKPIQTNALAQDTIKSLQVLADEASVKLVHVQNSIDFTVDADRTRILQVLMNLISNAIKFTPPEGSVTLSIDSQTNGYVRFSVTDTGCGIDEKLFPKLFQKFQQLDSSDSRQYGGTGLGLAISKSLVERHKGNIGVSSVVGEGTTFWFELPLSVSQNQAEGTGECSEKKCSSDERDLVSNC
ncbi:MAG TPA: ATP-binding protein [Drouetiella sp.]